MSVSFFSNSLFLFRTYYCDSVNHLDTSMYDIVKLMCDFVTPKCDITVLRQISDIALWRYDRYMWWRYDRHMWWRCDVHMWHHCVTMWLQNDTLLRCKCLALWSCWNVPTSICDFLSGMSFKHVCAIKNVRWQWIKPSSRRPHMLLWLGCRWGLSFSTYQ